MKTTITLHADSKEDRIKALDFLDKEDITGMTFTFISKRGFVCYFDDGRRDTKEEISFEIEQPTIYHCLNIQDEDTKKMLNELINKKQQIYFKNHPNIHWKRGILKNEEGGE